MARTVALVINTIHLVDPLSVNCCQKLLHLQQDVRPRMLPSVNVRGVILPCCLKLPVRSSKLTCERATEPATTSCRFKMPYCSDMTLAGPFRPHVSLAAAPIPRRWDVTRPSISPYRNATVDSPCRLANTTVSFSFLFDILC